MEKHRGFSVKYMPKSSRIYIERVRVVDRAIFPTTKLTDQINNFERCPLNSMLHAPTTTIVKRKTVADHGY